ncbi:MAG TPA: GDSL-type esterase/lipase family protein [Myxococcota bacterium]|nr:GDSL-type esterase/lipase family protein [Myxococcota bacterium]
MTRPRRTALGIAVLAVAIELLLRLFAPEPDPLKPPSDRIHRFLPAWNQYGTPPLSYLFPAGKLHGVAPNDRPDVINRWGFFYPEEKQRRTRRHEFRIAVLGGSTVECIALRPENRWPAVLESVLRQAEPTLDFTVLNLGISAQATWTHLSNLAHHVVGLDVDLVVVMIGANDLARARADYENMMLDTMFIASPELTPRLVGRWLGTRTQIGRHIRDAYLRIIGETRSDEPYFQPRVRLLHDVPVLEDVPDFKPEALLDYEREIVSIGAIARANGIEILFVDQPALWKDVNTPEEESVFWFLQYSHNDQLAKLRASAAAKLLERLNERLLNTCSRHDLRCLDLVPLVPRSLDNFYDDVHFNDHGARLVATEVAKAMLPTIRRVASGNRRS